MEGAPQAATADHRESGTGRKLLLSAAALGATGAVTNRLDVDATGLSPSASVHRTFDVVNSASTTFSTFTLSTTATTSSLLDTDAVDGLQVRLERCTTAWTESGSAPGYTYSCSGTRTQALAFRPVAMTAVPLGSMQSATPGGTDHLLLTEHLPTTADNTFQNQTSAFTFTVDAA